MGKEPKPNDVFQTQRKISKKNAFDKYRLEKWSDDPVGIPTYSNITTDDYEKLKEYYLVDLSARGNQRLSMKRINKN